MDVISYEYPKQRREFGVHPSFDDAPPKTLEVVPTGDVGAYTYTLFVFCRVASSLLRFHTQWEWCMGRVLFSAQLGCQGIVKSE